jgi:hypothetical protein
MSVEENTSEFDNLSIRVGLNETNKQMTSRYLAGLNQFIRDESGEVHLFNLEDARQYALMVENQVLRYKARRPLSSKVEGAKQRGSTIFRNVCSDQTAQKIGRDTSIINKPDSGYKYCQY